MTTPQPGPEPSGDPHAQIAAEALRVHDETYGTSAERAVVHILDDVVIILLDGLDLPASERTLVDGGHHEVVLNTRAAFQREIAPTFKAIVERATGRRVTSFLSNTCLDTPYSVEIFRLAP